MGKSNENKKKLWILFFTIMYSIIFAVIYIATQNYEFIGYIFVMLFLAFVAYRLNKKYEFSPGVLLGLSIWGILHMTGGILIVKGDVLYRLILIPIYQHPEIQEFVIMKFDQFAHFYFYFFATLFSFYLLKPHLNKNYSRKMIYVLLIFIGMGIGALNEIIEFGLVLTVKSTGVGGYYNTLLDIIFNTLGAIAAVIYIHLSGKK